jgi:hypothetical protein
LVADNAVIWGTIYATNGEFTGEITATGGDIGGWNVSRSELSSGSTFLSGLGSKVYWDEDAISGRGETVEDAGLSFNG